MTRATLGYRPFKELSSHFCINKPMCRHDVLIKEEAFKSEPGTLQMAQFFFFCSSSVPE